MRGRMKNASGQVPKKQKFVRLNVGADNILDPGETTTIQLVFSKAFWRGDSRCWRDRLLK